MKKIIIIITSLLIFSCTGKHAEIRQVTENHWVFDGDQGIEASIKTKDYEVNFDTEQDPPKIVTKEDSGGIFGGLSNIISWIPLI